MIGCFGTYFTDSHYLIAGDADWILKPVEVPKLKNGNIQADVCWIERVVLDNFVEKSSEVFNVVHVREVMSYRFSVSFQGLL